MLDGVAESRTRKPGRITFQKVGEGIPVSFAHLAEHPSYGFMHQVMFMRHQPFGQRQCIGKIRTALGEALLKALGDKRGIERYGYCLPMDDCLCSVALDFGGRPWLVWDAEFHREKVGDMPTEMFLHFFKSLSDAARMNLNIKAEGTNEHHKIEGIFKALARSIKMAIRRDIYRFELPSTKGTL